jgi:hypothetical protein
MTEHDSSENRPVDLGLTALISEAAKKKSSSEDEPETLEHEEIGEEDSQEEPVCSSRNQFEQLCEDKAWNELNSASESSLGTSGLVGLEAKLWWLRAQYELSAMPSSILVVPLESLLEDFREYGSLEEPPPEGCSQEERIRIYGYAASFVALLKDQISEKTYSELEQRCSELGCGVSFVDLSSAENSVPESSNLEEEAEEREFKQMHHNEAALPLSNKQPLGSVLYLLGLVTVLLGGWFYLQEGEVLSSRSPQVALTVEPPPLQGPQGERIARVSQLDAVLFDAETEPPSPDEKATVDEVSLRQEPPQRVKKTVSPKTKSKEIEVVDTSGPLEPDNLYERTPVSSDSRGSASEYASRRSGQETGGRTILGARVFRVLVRTEVLAKPTFTSERIGFLSVGDEVEVERSEGPWLQVRSRMGRVGFVMSQDVFPAR